MSLFRYIPFLRRTGYRVLFYNMDGELLKEEWVRHGENATAPADPTMQQYIFDGWDTVFTNVTSNLIVTAEYTPKRKWSLSNSTKYNNADTKITFDRTADPNPDACRTQENITAWILANRNPNDYAVGAVARVLHNYVIEPFDPVDCTTYYYKTEENIVDVPTFIFTETRIAGGKVRSNDFTMPDTFNLYTSYVTDFDIGTDGSIQYQINSGSWTNVPQGGTILVTENDIIRFEISSLSTDTKNTTLTIKLIESTGMELGKWVNTIVYSEEPRYTFNIRTSSAIAKTWVSTTHTIPDGQGGNLYIGNTRQLSTDGVVEYSINDGSWVGIDNTTVAVSAGNTIKLRVTQTDDVDCWYNVVLRIGNSSGFFVGSWYVSLGTDFNLHFRYLKNEATALSNNYFTTNAIIPRACTITFYISSSGSSIIKDSTNIEFEEITVDGVRRYGKTIEFSGGEVVSFIIKISRVLWNYPATRHIKGFIPAEDNLEVINFTITVSGVNDTPIITNN